MILARIAALFALVVSPAAQAAADEPTVTASIDAGAPTASPAPPPEPPRAAVVVAPPPPGPTQPPPHRPGTGLGLELGYASGGDRFLQIAPPAGGLGESADAGEGVLVSLAASWMAFWNNDGVGLGVYASAGMKYVVVGSELGQISYRRYPISLAAQVLVPVAPRWFLLGRVGALTEVAAKLKGTGAATGMNTNFRPQVGQFMDAGVYRALSGHSGVAFLVRYTQLDISMSGGEASANSLAAALAVYFSI